MILTGCFSGGITSGVVTNTSQEVQPDVPIPVVVIPFSNPYYSKDNFIDITGLCMTGNTVSIRENNTITEQVCANATFTFTSPKNTDGVYTYLITQTNSSNQVTSAPAPVVWIRKTSVGAPVVLNPPRSPYLSATSNLVISGSCESDSTISLGGDGVGSVVCTASQFSMNLPKAIDGDYTISVTQTDIAGNTASTSFVWQKKNLTASPLNPLLQVNTAQAFTVSGGNGQYSVRMVTNNSGGTFDLPTLTYTTGQLANVTDVIEFSDGLGLTAQVSINVIPGQPDHLEKGELGLNTGDGQIASIGSVLTDPFKVKVVDQFGNGVAHYPLYFHQVLGDGKITSPVLQVSDLNGFAQVNFQLGYSQSSNVVFVSPVSLNLPDVAGSLNPTLTFSATAVSSTKHLGATYDVGQVPSQTVIADFNGDNKSDLAVLNSGSPSIGILFGKGKNLFEDSVALNGICNNPNAIVSGDFNKDNKIDLMISCGNSISAAMQILFGVGDGTFQSPVNIDLDPLESIPKAISVDDFNNDTKLDVALTSSGAAKVSVRFGVGDGTFQSPVVYDVGDAPTAIIAVDLNKDNRPDLVVANAQSDNVSVLMNTGSGLFAAAVNYDAVNPVALAVADFNSDTFTDVAYASGATSSVGILLNDLGTNFNAGVDLGVGSSPNSLVAADFDKDGKADLFVSNGDDATMTVITGLGTGLFNPASSVSVVQNPVFMMTADLDADTILDFVVLGNQDRVLQVLPGQYAAATGYTIGYSTQVDLGSAKAVTEDFNKDGKLDVAVVNTVSKTVNILIGKGNGLFEKTLSLVTNDSSSSIIAVDLRKNGQTDLIVTNPVLGQVMVLLGKGDGTFDAPMSYAVGTLPSALISQDFNNDGVVDLAVTNSQSNNVSVLIGRGDGTFFINVDYAVGASPSAIVSADLNEDHVMDLIITNKNGGSVSVLIGNSNGTFQSQVNYNSGAGPSALLASDLNNDGHVDIAVNASTDGVVNILLGNGNGVLSLGVNDSYSAGLAPSDLVSGDFNGDGVIDLAVGNGVNQNFTVLWGNGSGRFQNSTSFSTGFNTDGLYVGDFNADGFVDLGVIDGSNSALKMWMGH